MAIFCSKCGAELPAGAQTCAACGMLVPGVAAPSQPVAAPAKSGGSALKIVLIIVAVFIGLGIIAAGAIGYVGWRIARTVRVSDSGKQVSVNIPGEGSFSAGASQTYSASDLGTDMYPGAQSGKGSMRMTLPTGSMVTAIFVTPDSKEKVLDFYKDKFGSGASIVETSESSIVTLEKSEQESVAVTIHTGSSEYEGKTQIVIVHTITNKPA